MKRIIGLIAAVVAVIDLFIYIILLVTGNAFTNPLFTGFIFFMWFLLLLIAGVCLIGDVIKYIGKQFSAGYNSSAPVQVSASAFCKNCGKTIDASVPFCPYCGAKQ